MEAYMGTVMAWAPNFAPRGWAFCQGQTLSITQNSALFSLLGTTYGGDGQTTFRLPDLRGRTPLGAGNGPGLSPYELGQSSGAESVTITLNEMPAHNHAAQTGNAPIQVSASNADTSTPANGLSIAVPGTVSGRDFSPTLGFNSAAPNVTLNQATSGPAAVNVGVSGGSHPHNNMQPYLALNFIICMQGIFPPRN
ncbi:tail fiber protein [Dyadobacter sp. LHD-138]|uniref:phage tail protein n=1 Tax=Dyadobacter sp. LHD-138 TaxID=3071413 RepID=UPI0027E0DF26|nr:tail fiber protein [Dyadobacter sp. LHD-138]MDQ6477210.1 tail fiber protein [Dyadobacter sp. LHD-138]